MLQNLIKSLLGPTAEVILSFFSLSFFEKCYIEVCETDIHILHDDNPVNILEPWPRKCPPNTRAQNPSKHDLEELECRHCASIYVATS